MQVNSEPTTQLASPPGEATRHRPREDGRAPAPSAVVRQLTAGDAEKAAALRKMKLVALCLLIAMAVVFVVAFALQKQYPWLEYVRAAAEGGMVGALADWFAVTALFRYPMGLKIPHTAIIPRRKDQIGASLGEFVETNFLSEQVVQDKLASINISGKVGSWLSGPGGAERVAKEGAAVIRGTFKVLNDDDVQAVIEGMVRKHLLAPPWGPPVGRMAERIFADGHHHKLVDLLVDRAADWVAANHQMVSRLVTERSPQWVPSFVDGLVGDKVYIELLKFTRAVQDDQQHQVRLSIDKYLTDLAQELQHDPAINDEELAGKVNAWIGDAAGYLVRTYRSDIAGVITDTVARWDAEETSQKIELQVGKDLQFIRINGTVVGSLAGLAIFTLAHLTFG
jgi:uncharacterized membrane-anchored protein YjiN (DUF445 family)